MKVTVTSGWWDQKTGDGYTRHLKGQEIEVSDEVGEWLVKAGAAVGSIPAETAVQKPQRRRTVGEK